MLKCGAETMSGKRILSGMESRLLPFCTSSSSGIGRSGQNLADECAVKGCSG